MTTNDADQQFSAGTVEDGARLTKLYAPPDFTGEGKKSGHGSVAWLPAPDTELPSVPWQPQRPPVIALLDSGVQTHSWLPATATRGSPWMPLSTAGPPRTWSSRPRRLGRTPARTTAAITGTPRSSPGSSG